MGGCSSCSGSTEIRQSKASTAWQLGSDARWGCPACPVPLGCSSSCLGARQGLGLACSVVKCITWEFETNHPWSLQMDGNMIQSRKWGKSITRTVKAKQWKRCQLVKGSMILNYPSPFALALILFFVAKLPGTSALFLRTYIFSPSLRSGCHQVVFEHSSIAQTTADE